ncbi:LysR family transcriptional regulator [Lentzea tibetensis]|uniref:LysR family transcriptional regulator n=1 Tax=Lentzea tibetensis TaxID=2591470 RepID=A0A563F1Z7_9PSEU|nr:LysR family transcriptional regulator [Lentzea tibetensis]TWP53771.1 LysR family transcriptional regulator [Lentzea tibetensis]
MEVEVRQLRMICQIVKSGSMTRAAAELNITQPALTYQLQRAERMFGGALFVRDRRGTRPTALGELVLNYARTLLPSLDKLVSETRLRTETGADVPSLVRMASQPSPVAAPVVQRLGELLPGSELVVRQQRSGREILELIAASNLELATVLEHPELPLPRPDGVVLHEIVTEPLFVAMAATGPLADRSEIRLADLAEQSWILPEELEVQCSEYLHLVCQRAGFTPTIGYRLGGFTARDVLRRGLAVALAQATSTFGDGVAVLPIADVKTELRHVLAIAADSPVAVHTAALLEAADAGYWDSAARAGVYQRWLTRRMAG